MVSLCGHVGLELRVEGLEIMRRMVLHASGLYPKP